MSAILKKRAPLALAVALAIFCAASPLAERRETHAASSSVDKVVMAGDPAPGGGTFTDFNGAVSLSDGGQVAFRATLSTGSTGIFLASPATSGYAISKVVATGDANPAGGTFSSGFSSPSLNSAGQVAFSGRASGQPESIFLASPMDAGFSVSVVASTGVGGNPQTPSLNDAGAVVFFDHNGCCNQESLFVAQPHLSGFNIVQVIGTGTFETPVSLNNSNHVAFAGCVQFCGAPLAIYSDASIVVQGNGYSIDKYPGVFAPASLNDANLVAFRGCLWPCPNLGLLVASPTTSGFSFETVISYGDSAPSGGTFSSTGLSAESLNNAGQVAFDAYVSDAPGNGIFLASPTSAGFQIDQVVVAGDLMPGGEALARVASPSLNATGQLAFWGCVSDCGTATHGIFLASPDSPTPTATSTETPTPTTPDTPEPSPTPTPT